METKNVNFLSIALRNGILLGLASVAFTVLLYVTDSLYTDNTLLAIITWLINIAISVVFIVITVEQYKKANEGFLSIGEAIKVGVLVAVIAGVIGAIYQVIYATIIDPDYYDKVVEVAMKKMSAMANFNEEQLEEFQDKMYANKPSIASSFSTSIVFSAIGGLIISAIVGAVKKKEQPMSL
jgi:putative membrane protein